MKLQSRLNKTRHYPMLREIDRLMRQLLDPSHAAAFFWAAIPLAAVFGFIWSVLESSDGPWEWLVLAGTLGYFALAIVCFEIVFWWPRSLTGRTICNSRKRMRIVLGREFDQAFDQAHIWNADRFREELSRPEISVNQRERLRLQATMFAYPLLLPLLLRFLKYEEIVLSLSRRIKSR